MLINCYPPIHVFCKLLPSVLIYIRGTFFSFSFLHFIIPFEKFRPPYPSKATAAARAALSSAISACFIFLCFHNPPNSDMDCRIFNVRTWSFLCVRIHTGIRHTDESAQYFWLEKTLTIVSCVPDRVRILGLWISSPALYQLSHPVPRQLTCTVSYLPIIMSGKTLTLQPLPPIPLLWVAL